MEGKGSGQHKAALCSSEDLCSEVSSMLWLQRNSQASATGGYSKNAGYKVELQ